MFALSDFIPEIKSRYHDMRYFLYLSDSCRLSLHCKKSIWWGEVNTIPVVESWGTRWMRFPTENTSSCERAHRLVLELLGSEHAEQLTLQMALELSECLA